MSRMTVKVSEAALAHISIKMMGDLKTEQDKTSLEFWALFVSVLSAFNICQNRLEIKMKKIFQAHLLKPFGNLVNLVYPYSLTLN